MSKKFFDLQRFDDIANSIPNSVVTGTINNDSISNTAAIVTIQGNGGNDTVSNEGDIVKIYCGGGDDSITNSGKNVTISGGSGNNQIYSSGANVTIGSTDGNDSITTAYGNYASVNSGEGDDYIYANGNMYSLIFGNSGDDTIYNNEAHFNSISGGTGNDSINSQGIDVTINGGKGDDTISLSTKYNSANLIQYSTGDGNDAITGFNSNDTLQITAGTISSMTSGSDIYFLIGSGSITLKNVGNGVGSSNFVIVKTPSLPTGLSYSSDKISITASSKFTGSSINLTKYSTVENLNASAVTRKLKITGNAFDNKIQGGSKKDTIKGGAGNDSIRGNAGNDRLYGETGNDTLLGGTGNDTLTGGDGADVFVHSSGNDVITDYIAGTDAIRLDNAAVKSWKISGKHVVFTTTKGKVTVRNGKGKSITIIETKTYSSSSSKTSALLAENNFVTADNLSGIVENKLSAVSEIQTPSFENLTQENLITYTEK